MFAAACANHEFVENRVAFAAVDFGFRLRRLVGFPRNFARRARRYVGAYGSVSVDSEKLLHIVGVEVFGRTEFYERCAVGEVFLGLHDRRSYVRPVGIFRIRNADAFAEKAFFERAENFYRAFVLRVRNGFVDGFRKSRRLFLRELRRLPDCVRSADCVCRKNVCCDVFCDNASVVSCVFYFRRNAVGERLEVHSRYNRAYEQLPRVCRRFTRRFDNRHVRFVRERRHMLSPPLHAVWLHRSADDFICRRRRFRAVQIDRHHDCAARVRLRVLRVFFLGDREPRFAVHFVFLLVLYGNAIYAQVGTLGDACRERGFLRNIYCLRRQGGAFSDFELGVAVRRVVEVRHGIRRPFEGTRYCLGAGDVAGFVKQHVGVCVYCADGELRSARRRVERDFSDLLRDLDFPARGVLSERDSASEHACRFSADGAFPVLLVDGFLQVPPRTFCDDFRRRFFRRAPFGDFRDASEKFARASDENLDCVVDVGHGLRVGRERDSKLVRRRRFAEDFRRAHREFCGVYRRRVYPENDVHSILRL